MEDVASELGLSRTTLYELIVRYRATRTVEVLQERGRGRPKGSLHMEPARDALIQQFLEREYLKPTRPPLRRVIEHIAAAGSKVFRRPPGGPSRPGCYGSTNALAPPAAARRAWFVRVSQRLERIR